MYLVRNDRPRLPAALLTCQAHEDSMGEAEARDKEKNKSDAGSA